MLCILALFPFASLYAQNYTGIGDSTLIKSMGFPTRWKPQVTPLVAYDKRDFDDGIAGEINLGMYKDILNPVIGLFGLTGEGYIRSDAADFEGGARLFGTSRYLFVQGGVDYRFGSGDVSFVTSIFAPLRRGGPLQRGGCLRIDWSPGHTHTFSVGLSIPLAQPWQGKTRPKKDHVSLANESPLPIPPFTLDERLQHALTNIRHAAKWINNYTIPFLDKNPKSGESDLEAFREMINDYRSHINTRDSLYPEGHSFREEVEVYHRELENAFTIACSGGVGGHISTSGTEVAAKAREILIDEVILPYNRLLGQWKWHDSVMGYGKRACELFHDWLNAYSDLPEENIHAAMYVFQALLNYIDENRAKSRKIWGDSRLVWIPMHYGLRFEDHDTETELDAILEKAVQQEFTDANDIHYVVNELFHPELSRMIELTRDYHVLWIHDFKGVNAENEPDAIAFETVIDYLQALIDRINSYGTTGKIPTYMIFLDQHYYEINKSRFWLEVLADPLRHDFHMCDQFKFMEDSIRVAQERLREAVANSRALQEDVKLYGEDWLYNRIKIHINITNPSDLSFRSTAIIRYLGYLPDNVMRDHRKIAFYDVTELDPGKGEGLYTGLGVGAGYLGPTWDDRSLLVRGPALLSLKNSARQLLLSQGIALDDIPAPLRRLPKPDNYDEMIDNLRRQGWTATTMQVHNATGFGQKDANIVKAILYNLMPNGSHLYIPDSIWIGPFWGAMVIGASLRGCWVLVVSPALENAPSASVPVMSRANELFTRFVIVQNLMKEEITAAGGLFRTGIYTMELDVGDVVGKLRVLNEGIARSELFQTVFPFSQSVIELVSRMPDYLDSLQIKPQYIIDEKNPRRPRLHLKSQFFASERTINTVAPLKGWEQLIKKYIIARAKQTAYGETEVGAVDLRQELEKESAALFAEWSKSTANEERPKAIIYLTVGSQNQDYRSMIMDGETLCVVARIWAMVAYLDFVSIMAQTTWIDNVDQLNELLPRHGGFWKWLGRFIKNAL